MEYRRLGRSDLNVSPICLGSMTWGEQNSDAESFEQLDYAIDQGVNFIDTAVMYPIYTLSQTYRLTAVLLVYSMSSLFPRFTLVFPTMIFFPHSLPFPFFLFSSTPFSLP